MSVSRRFPNSPSNITPLRSISRSSPTESGINTNHPTAPPPRCPTPPHAAAYPTRSPQTHRPPRNHNIPITRPPHKRRSIEPKIDIIQKLPPRTHPRRATRRNPPGPQSAAAPDRPARSENRQREDPQAQPASPTHPADTSSTHTPN